MNPQLKTLAPFGIAALAFLIYVFSFTVSQWEMAIKLRLGEIVQTDYEPGLHFKVPGLNTIITFDRRIQTLDARPQRFLTLEKKDVIVDSYAKWRISNAAQFYRSTGGNPTRTANCWPTASTPACATSLADAPSRRSSRRIARRSWRPLPRGSIPGPMTWGWKSSMCGSRRSTSRQRSASRSTHACVPSVSAPPVTCAPRAARPPSASRRTPTVNAP